MNLFGALCQNTHSGFSTRCDENKKPKNHNYQGKNRVVSHQFPFRLLGLFLS